MVEQKKQGGRMVSAVREWTRVNKQAERRAQEGVVCFAKQKQSQCEFPTVHTFEQLYFIPLPSHLNMFRVCCLQMSFAMNENQRRNKNQRCTFVARGSHTEAKTNQTETYVRVLDYSANTRILTTHPNPDIIICFFFAVRES